MTIPTTLRLHHVLQPNTHLELHITCFHKQVFIHSICVLRYINGLLPLTKLVLAQQQTPNSINSLIIYHHHSRQFVLQTLAQCCPQSLECVWTTTCPRPQEIIDTHESLRSRSLSPIPIASWPSRRTIQATPMLSSAVMWTSQDAISGIVPKGC